mgnify:CR=1 FL=1
MRDNEFIIIRDNFYGELKPKAIKAEIDGWNFYTNSTDENREKLEKSQEEVFKLFRNTEVYNKLKEIEKSGVEDKHLAKQLKKTIEGFEEEFNSSEYKKALREKENEILGKYSKYVPMIDDKETTYAEISKIIQREKNIDLRKKAYEAKVKGGDLIAENLVSLVKIRNEYAKTKGYKNFFEYILKDIYDVDSDYLQNLLDEIYDNAKEINIKFQN